MSSITSLRGAHAPSTASDEDESTYIKRTRTLHWVRIGLCAVTLALATAIIATEGHALQYYNQMSKYEKMYLALWPENLELRPSVALVIGGVILALQSLAYSIVALLPSPRSRILLLNSFATAISIIGFVAALIAVVFTLIYTNPHSENGSYRGETINSWTCTWGFGGRDADGVDIDAVADFPQLFRVVSFSGKGLVSRG
ncbi:predicted protein [Uncinocarpus reesii 1704]|uniref:Uncharacterized protein n=1 Tax=Uncinocarpus reesii (strain UAMH 1704) TaxID=336963 RepID=C4JIQ8_UNCRE|nr:uncharacterized protein UREG_02919 [Uncinocarpus reesii 1704]EEP78070.1 predicted protein [Uncinocarpus reesii 1704]